MYIIDMGGFLAADPIPWEEPTRAIAGLVASSLGETGRTAWGEAVIANIYTYTCV